MKKINESFICKQCKEQVEPANKTCRNHCPYCFSSLHVDGKIPGDRDTDCGGLMYPTSYEIRNRKNKLHFICITCGKTHHNKTADDDNVGDLDSYIMKYKKIILQRESGSDLSKLR